MREIKFRAWHSKVQKMFDVIEINWRDQTAAFHESALKYNTRTGFLEGKENEAWANIYGRLTFMQYTGLRDKNGVEIYEGDIVEQLDMRVNVGETWQKGKVIFSPSQGYLCGEFPLYFQECEVIGNIYENPELVG